MKLFYVGTVPMPTGFILCKHCYQYDDLPKCIGYTLSVVVMQTRDVFMEV
jgi:hypothetical protein